MAYIASHLPHSTGDSGASPLAQCRESACSAGDTRDASSIMVLERPLGGGHGNSLQYFCREKSHGQRNRVGYSPWVAESGTAEVTEYAHTC